MLINRMRERVGVDRSTRSSSVLQLQRWHVRRLSYTSQRTDDLVRIQPFWAPILTID